MDEDELEEVYRHFDECGECVSWLAGAVRAEGVLLADDYDGFSFC